MDGLILPKRPGADCQNCTLRAEPFVGPKGPEGRPQLVVVGEAPGADEVRVGEPFVGKSGQLLQAMLSQIGQEWEGVWRTNVVLCRPPKNRTPNQLEQKCCAPRLFEELEQLGESVPLVALEIGRA